MWGLELWLRDSILGFRVQDFCCGVEGFGVSRTRADARRARCVALGAIALRRNRQELCPWRAAAERQGGEIVAHVCKAERRVSKERDFLLNL